MSKAAATIDVADLQDPILYIRMVREGLSGPAIKQLFSYLGVGKMVIANALHIDESNLPRLLKRQVLTKDQSETLLDTARIFVRLSKIFGDPKQGMAWMDSEIPALGGQRPTTLLDTFEGRRWIDQVLTSIEYGEFA